MSFSVSIAQRSVYRSQSKILIGQGGGLTQVQIAGSVNQTLTATMSDLLRVVERSRDDPMDVENWLAREHSAAGAADPTAPQPAGAGA